MKHKAFLLGLMVGIVACSGSKKEQPKEASPRPGQEQLVLKSLEREYIEPVFPEDMAQERTNWQNPDIVLKSFSNLSEQICNFDVVALWGICLLSVFQYLIAKSFASFD